MDGAYLPRTADQSLKRLLSGFPAVLVVGPRATGKTTTALRQAQSVVRLDLPAEAAAFKADPDAALRGWEEPLLIDEWQVVPEVLGAIKRAVDADSRTGRFILTGSVRADLESPTWPGTGRIIRLPLLGLTGRELAGRASAISPLDVLAAGQLERFGRPDGAPDLPGYIDLALRGGFPDTALRDDEQERSIWLESYLDQLLTRDASQIANRDPNRMARYFEAIALNSAGIVADTTISEAAGINRKTADEYQALLVNLFVLDVVPAWVSNRLSRLVKATKRYLVDPALMGAALRVDVRAVMRDGNLIGRVLDTYVAAQLRAEAATSATRPRLYHLREKNGRREIDLLAEVGGGGIVAFEIKATAAPSRGDAKHLLWLRDELGERFRAGVVFHTGPATIQLDDRVAAIPIAGLWSAPAPE